MSKVRVIARIDVKNEFVIKGIHLEGLRKVGDPNELAQKYYNSGVDEIVFMDAVAAYYDRNNLSDIIEKACKDVFVPITVGGGIRSVEDIHLALKSGADKVAINTKAVRCPSFIEEASKTFGSQCVVVSIDAKRLTSDKWEVYVDNGREPTGLDVIDWARRIESLGAGEIMVTSIDAEGTKKGFDVQLNNSVSSVVGIPVIASGGAGSVAHVVDLVKRTDVRALGVASILHYNISSIGDIKSQIFAEGIEVRI
jgi:imidazole glycerol-phosphate synthase subunit HisF